MQVDQFESEVESLSVQTRKKKGDKEVSVSHRVSLCLSLNSEILIAGHPREGASEPKRVAISCTATLNALTRSASV